jgi:Protein of unknown function (DUF1553)/Protein of unknown function (DUF1549)/Planctomycete cytochrome C
MRLLVLVLIFCASIIGIETVSGDPVSVKKDTNDSVSPKAEITFEKHIRPILRKHCFDCHGSQGEREGKLDLRLRRFMVKGGESGPSIIPGQPKESLLIEKISEGEMPPGNTKMEKAEIELVKKWIQSGAFTARAEPEKLDEGLTITPEDREYWAFHPITKPKIPTHQPNDRVRTPIDSLLLPQMHSKGVAFSVDAEKLTYIRRATYDLTGLPPQPDEIIEFLTDSKPGAHERLIDRLLDSKHYGERWGRHWLDVAGYADSEGSNNLDSVRAYSFRYRDYVIRSFNQDKPFSQFIVEQLAGDELVKPPYKNLTPDQIEKLVATGFLRMAADGTGSGGEQEVKRNQVVADTIKIVSTSLLGVSVGCAQCHDHRYDPILQTDYYRMRALFEPAYDWKNWRVPNQRRVSLYTDEDRALANKINQEANVIAKVRTDKQNKYIQSELDKELKKYDEAIRGKLRKAYETPAKKRTAEQKEYFKKYPSLNINSGNLYQYNPKAAEELKKLSAQVAKIRARKKPEEFIRVLSEPGNKVPKTFLFHRGEHSQPKQEISPGGLAVTAAEGKQFTAQLNDPSIASTGRRLAYAKWLTNGKHPLVARVIVNRVWLHHFGKGIVNSPGEFGNLGGKPTHPELLDWLASEFMENGWSMKHLHRIIMKSTVYRQTSVRDSQFVKKDPGNTTYWHMPVVRLDAEVIRDSVLATSGVLNPKMYGSPVPVKEDGVGQVVIGVDKKGSANRPGANIPMNGKENRRSIYIQVRRSRPLAITRVFDAPVMKVNCDRRISSTAATQALTMMNSKFILQYASYFANRVAELSKNDTTSQIKNAWMLAYTRSATDKELEKAKLFLNKQVEYLKSSDKKTDKKKGAKPAPELQAMTNLCQILLSSNEFLYVD